MFVAEFVGLSNRFAGRIVGQSGAGLYEVEFDAGSRVRAVGPDRLSDGQAVSVIVRPEELRIAGPSGPDSGSSDALRAIVSSISYLGPSRQLRLEAETFGELVAVVQGASRAAGEGDRVTVAWSPDAAWIVPDGPA
jgi:ABC-type Fe3+/spermidine/putrescine transport system ATPase subunit